MTCSQPCWQYPCGRPLLAWINWGAGRPHPAPQCISNTYCKNSEYFVSIWLKGCTREWRCPRKFHGCWLPCSVVLRTSSLTKSLISTQQRERYLWSERPLSPFPTFILSLFLLKEKPKSSIHFDLLPSCPMTLPSSLPTQTGGFAQSTPRPWSGLVVTCQVRALRHAAVNKETWHFKVHLLPSSFMIICALMFHCICYQKCYCFLSPWWSPLKLQLFSL